jgi:hypothetical protein
MGIRAIAVSAVCWLPFMVTGVSAQQQEARTYIANPGCETAGTPPRNWTQVTGNWSCGAYPTTPPQEGTAYFRPGNSANAELRQDIPVSGLATTIDLSLATAEFRGYVRCFRQPVLDLSRIVIEYRDATNASVLSSFDSGNLSSFDAWRLVTDTRPIPVGTRTIRIRLISTRGEFTSNDGYYDDLALGIEVPKSSCRSDVDCHLVGCDDCSCIALPVGESTPAKCKDPNAACVVAPCLNKVAACVTGQCVVKPARPM